MKAILLLRIMLVVMGLLMAATVSFAEKDKTNVSELQQLAEQGDAKAQVSLGLEYRRGRDLPQDYGLARNWFLKAAEQGSAEGQNNLGLMYDHGRGVEKDFVQARKWYLQAAKQGHSNAQYNLALLYTNGQGVPQDDIEAYVWANIAAAQGNSGLAKDLRNKLRNILGPTCISKAQEQSKEYFEKYVAPFQ